LQKRNFKIVSNGTDNHLMLVDLRCIDMTGKQADQLVSGVNITATKIQFPLIRSRRL
jgi:glycine hydroxymethyltransferase